MTSNVMSKLIFLQPNSSQLISNVSKCSTQLLNIDDLVNLSVLDNFVCSGFIEDKNDYLLSLSISVFNNVGNPLILKNINLISPCIGDNIKIQPINFNLSYTILLYPYYNIDLNFINLRNNSIVTINWNTNNFQLHCIYDNNESSSAGSSGIIDTLGSSGKSGDTISGDGLKWWEIFLIILGSIIGAAILLIIFCARGFQLLDQ